MSKRCSNCGHENRDVAIFCGNCGNRLIAQNMGTQNMANNFTGGSSSSTKNNPKPNYVNKAKGSDSGSLCCAVFLILFIIILIMSIG